MSQANDPPGETCMHSGAKPKPAKEDIRLALGRYYKYEYSYVRTVVVGSNIRVPYYEYLLDASCSIPCKSTVPVRNQPVMPCCRVYSQRGKILLYVQAKSRTCTWWMPLFGTPYLRSVLRVP